MFVSGDQKNYAYRTVNARARESKTVCKVRGYTLNYAAAHLANFDSIRYLISGADARDVITVRTEMKIKRKMRMCDGSGVTGAGPGAIVSGPEAKVYRVSFHKRKRLDDFYSVPFAHIKDEQSCSTSLSIS